MTVPKEGQGLAPLTVPCRVINSYFSSVYSLEKQDLKQKHFLAEGTLGRVQRGNC